VPDEVKDEILSAVKSLKWGVYPDYNSVELKDVLSEYTGVPPEGILVGNGSNEMILSVYLAAVSRGEKILVTSPTFAVYLLLGSIVESELISVNLTEDLQFDAGALIEAKEKYNPKLTIIPSPNNPTGCVLTPEETEKILTAGDGITVIDEAYIQFTDNPDGAAALIDKFPNLVILRTFSKAFCAAGLRIGYILTNPLLAGEFRKTILPYNVDIFTQTAAKVLIERRSLIEKTIEIIITERERVYSELRKINGIKAYPSYANFILIEILGLEPKYVYEQLYARGILVRDMTSYPMLSKAFRVTIGKREENDIFLNELINIMER
ncbi:histidinol-phosphate transaminase, partial [bacterium]|nr:histidinol-phosphate transaminase [bacterium]